MPIIAETAPISARTWWIFEHSVLGGKRRHLRLVRIRPVVWLPLERDSSCSVLFSMTRVLWSRGTKLSVTLKHNRKEQRFMADQHLLDGRGTRTTTRILMDIYRGCTDQRQGNWQNAPSQLPRTDQPLYGQLELARPSNMSTGPNVQVLIIILQLCFSISISLSLFRLSLLPVSLRGKRTNLVTMCGESSKVVVELCT